MGKVKKAYLPPWVAWFTAIIMVPITVWIEYEAFIGKEPNHAAGIVTGIVMVGSIAMVLLMAYKKLPYMLIEED